jgi:hypothetical protein
MIIAVTLTFILDGINIAVALMIRTVTLMTIAVTLMIIALIIAVTLTSLVKTKPLHS